MELTTLEIPEDEARAKLAEYEGMLHDERTAEDDAIAAGYRAAARGLPIIRLSQSVAAGGFFDNGLPRIAVIRATEPECFVHWDGSDLVYSDGLADNRGALVGRATVRVTVAEKPRVTRHSSWSRAKTIVPIIPPRYRPRLRRLKGFHLLWEVESWTPVPPRDPALLRHIRGDLWAVSAVWDLTELERYVLSQRA
jgi:hypothetical protein